MEPGKTGLGTVAGSFRGQLDGRDRLAKARDPCVKAVQPQLLQADILQIPLESEQFHHGVGHRGAGGKHHAFAARNLVQIPAFQKQICGFLRFRLRDTCHIAHLGGKEQVFIIMRFIDENSVHAQRFKVDHIVLAGLIVQFGQLGFQCFAGALHGLDGESFAFFRLGLRDGENDIGNLVLQQPPLTVRADGDFLKLAVADDDRVVVAGGDAGAEFLAVFGFKVLLAGHQQIGRGVQRQELAGPLVDDVVGNHEQRFLGQPQPPQLHGGSGHFKSFARAHTMSQQRVAAVQNVGNGVFLVGAQLDFRVHAGEGQVTAVVFPRPDTVEPFIVKPAQPGTARRVLPDPFAKPVPDQLLLLLGQNGFLLVLDGVPLAVFIFLIIKNDGIPQIQGVLHQTVGVGPPGAVGAGGL